MIITNPEKSLVVTNSAYVFTPVPELSEWRCYLFGGTNADGNINGVVWQPVKGKEPNWFWRWMQYICFGNRWVKEVNDGKR